MTANELVDGFVSALNHRIEGALVLVEDAVAFEAASKDIESMIRSDLPPIVETLGEAGLDPDDRKHLESCLRNLAELEMKVRAKSVWARDLDDFMRDALSKND